MWDSVPEKKGTRLNNLERQLLAVGMTIFSPYVNKFERIKKKLTKEQRLIWFNEKAKFMGYKVFTIREMEKFTRMDKRTIQKIARLMVEKGHLR